MIKYLIEIHVFGAIVFTVIFFLTLGILIGAAWCTRNIYIEEGSDERIKND